MNNIRPDENGSVYININAGGASAYAYIGGMIINSYYVDTTASGSGFAPPAVIEQVNKDAVTKNDKDSNKGKSAGTQDEKQQNKGIDNKGSGKVEKESTVKAYPNPFSHDLTLSIDLTESVKGIIVTVYDISGRPVYSKQMNNLPSGNSLIQLGLSGNRIPSGVYVINVTGLPGGKTSSLRVLKR